MSKPSAAILGVVKSSPPMSPTKQIGIRLGDETIGRLDEAAKRFKTTRTDVAIRALEIGLKALEDLGGPALDSHNEIEVRIKPRKR